MRITILEFHRNANRLHQLQYPFRSLFLILADMIRLKRLSDDISNRHSRIQTGIGILENHLQLRPKRPEGLLIHGGDFLIMKGNDTVCCRKHVNQGPSKRRFSASALTDKRQRLSLIDFHADPVDRMHLLTFFARWEFLIYAFRMKQNFFFATHVYLTPACRFRHRFLYCMAHADQCSSPTFFRTGFSFRHASTAHSHLVQNVQPSGRCRRFGTTPGMV